MRRKKMTQKDINLFVALIVLIIGIISAIIMGIIKILQAIFSKKKNSESIQYRAPQKNEDLPVKNDVDQIIGGSSRYQIPTETPDPEASDQTPIDYQSINVHGYSVYNPPAPGQAKKDPR